MRRRVNRNHARPVTAAYLRRRVHDEQQHRGQRAGLEAVRADEHGEDHHDRPQRGQVPVKHCVKFC
jgi:hypothetical protein